MDVRPFAAREISTEVHLLSTPADYYGPVVGNVSIIEQRDGFVLVDTGLTAANGRAIVNYVRARSNKPVKAVVITHWHNDHPQGASAIREAWPTARVIATGETRKGMLGPALGEMVGLEPGEQYVAKARELNAQQQEALDKLIADPATAPDRVERAKRMKVDFAAFAESYGGTHMQAPTETFDKELRIDDPAVPVEVKFLGRANTAGDAVVWLPRQRIVMSGDMVVWPTPFGFFSFPGDWVQTLGRLKGLGYKTLIPGHGEPQTDTVYIDRLIGSIEDRYGAHVGRGIRSRHVRQAAGHDMELRLSRETRFSARFRRIDPRADGRTHDDAHISCFRRLEWEGPGSFDALTRAL